MTTRTRSILVGVLLLVPASVGITAGAWATPAGGTLVSVGSPAAPFSQNKQNEPAIAVDPMHTNILVAGANDNIDMEACNAGADNTCPFSDGVGVSGVYVTTNGGDTWTQPTYTGLTGRGCLGAIGDGDPGCTPTTGPIGTLPGYAALGLVSDGDPALAFGPTFVNGHPSWSKSRLYYVNLTSTFAGSFKGAEAIGVSRTDDVAAAVGDQGKWMAPVIASKQNGGKFSDKEQVWADNVSTSPYFGNVYICYAAFQGNGKGSVGQSLDVITSHDGGDSWNDQRITPAAENIHTRQGFGHSGCAIRTDSNGKVYVFYATFGFSPTGSAPTQIQLSTSSDGGTTWSKPSTIATTGDTCGYVEASIGRCVEDGVGGARSDLSPAPSVDIANGAPTGSDATNLVVLSYVDGSGGVNNEHVVFQSSPDGVTWSKPQDVEQSGDRGYYSAPAISPDGKNAWLVYNAFTTPFRTSDVGAGNDRRLVGVMLHAPVSGAGVGAWTEVDRGVEGDARGSSQNNLAGEFLGDYVYATATRTAGAAVWNDVRNAADCPAIDGYRQALHDLATGAGAAYAGSEEPGDEGDVEAPKGGPAPPAAPNVQQQCSANFGNSDIYGGVYPNP